MAKTKAKVKNTKRLYIQNSFSVYEDKNHRVYFLIINYFIKIFENEQKRMQIEFHKL